MIEHLQLLAQQARFGFAFGEPSAVNHLADDVDLFPLLYHENFFSGSYTPSIDGLDEVAQVRLYLLDQSDLNLSPFERYQKMKALKRKGFELLNKLRQWYDLSNVAYSSALIRFDRQLEGVEFTFRAKLKNPEPTC